MPPGADEGSILMNIKEDLRMECEEGILRCRLVGEIDHHTAKHVREKIDAEIFKSRPSGVILDFQEVRFMDSSGIGLIIGRAELCGELRIGVRLVGLSNTARKLVTLSGIDKLPNLTVSK